MSDRNLVIPAPGRLEIVTEPVEPGPFRVRTLYSGVSAGTELSFVKGTNPALHAGFDPVLGLFGGSATAAYPVRRLGYMEVGQVVESQTPAVAEGQVVAMTYGHRSGFTGDPLRDRVVPLPADLDPLLGIYVAHMGPICANGLLHAAFEYHGPAVRGLGDGVAGKRVVVTGAGVVGLLTALFARFHGAASVVVVDPTPERLAVASALGLDTLASDDGDPAVTLKTAWRHTADDRGADVVFQCRGQASALHTALRLLRPQGTVIDLAFYQGGAGDLELGAEFHHNGLAIRCAQIGRVPRGLAPTWDRERLSAATIELLRTYGAAIRNHLVTAVVPFDEGPQLLTDLAARHRQELQAVLEF
ncbi:zinc-binding alcohol dehydrogenase [Actinoplanes sp. NPDC049596]|uniref:zinc-dependent alcohol dehydrogenase n=1 Tax=unclassified Actinoplanes TaxID=2626549 RepID=UPI003432468C